MIAITNLDRFQKPRVVGLAGLIVACLLLCYQGNSVAADLPELEEQAIRAALENV